MVILRGWVFLMSEVPLYLMPFLQTNIGTHMPFWHQLWSLEGHLAPKKQRPPRTIQSAHAKGHMEVLEGWAVSYEQGTPVLRGRTLHASG